MWVRCLPTAAEQFDPEFTLQQPDLFADARL